MYMVYYKNNISNGKLKMMMKFLYVLYFLYVFVFPILDI